MKNNIAKYAGVGILTTAVGLNAGLLISDKLVDHTKEVCPIAKLENMFPYTFDGYKSGIYHQTDNMIQDYKDKGIDAYCTFDKGMVPAEKDDMEDRYFIIIDVDGNQVHEVTPDMELFEKDGVIWAKKKVPKKEVEGTIFTATYQMNGKEKTKTLTLAK